MLKRLTFAALLTLGLLVLVVIAQSSDMNDEDRASMYFEEIQTAPYTD